MKNNINIFVRMLVLCLLIIAVSSFFVFNNALIGYVLIGLSLVCLIYVRYIGISIREIRPDIVFGIIDNSVLVILSVFGGHFGGVAGAIIGGAVGNALTDGIAGVFEGMEAEKIDYKKSSILGIAVGKMAGCLLGAGVVLVFFHWLGW